MSRSLSVELKSHLLQDTTTIATCWRIDREDGVTLGFTDHQKDLTVDGQLYSAANGMRPSSVSSASGLGVDNLELLSVFDDSGVTERDLRAGLYDHAEVLLFIVNYEDLTMGKMIIKRGWLGTMRIKENQFMTEFRSMTQATMSEIVNVTSQRCRARLLGDAMCKKSLLGNTEDGIPITSTGEVLSVASKRQFTLDANGITYPTDIFLNGLCRFTSGENNGVRMETAGNSGSIIKIMLPVPFTIAPGDTVELITGCDRRIETCGDRYANQINHRGEDGVPGSHKVFHITQL